jgi:hypothetical protein
MTFINRKGNLLAKFKDQITIEGYETPSFTGLFEVKVVPTDQLAWSKKSSRRFPLFANDFETIYTAIDKALKKQSDDLEEEENKIRAKKLRNIEKQALRERELELQFENNQASEETEKEKNPENKDETKADENLKENEESSKETTVEKGTPSQINLKSTESSSAEPATSQSLMKSGENKRVLTDSSETDEEEKDNHKKVEVEKEESRSDEFDKDSLDDEQCESSLVTNVESNPSKDSARVEQVKETGETN